MAEGVYGGSIKKQVGIWDRENGGRYGDEKMKVDKERRHGLENLINHLVTNIIALRKVV